MHSLYPKAEGELLQGFGTLPTLLQEHSNATPSHTLY